MDAVLRRSQHDGSQGQGGTEHVDGEGVGQRVEDDDAAADLCGGVEDELGEGVEARF